MKIRLSTADLKRTLKDAERVSERKTTIPVLSHVLIELEPSGVRLSVTDLEIGRQEFVPYASPLPLPEDTPNPAGWYDEQCWARAVPLKALLALLPATAKRIKAAPVVELTANPFEDEGEIHVEVGGSETMLRTLPAEEFPTLPFPTPRYTGKRPTGKTVSEFLDPAVVPGQGFRQTVKKVFSAISTEESRFQLSGAFFEMNGRLRIGATDGHRLNRAETGYRNGSYGDRPLDSRSHSIEIGPELDLWPESDLSFLVPRKALACMLKDSAFGPIQRQEPMRADGAPVLLKSGPRKGQPRLHKVDAWPDVHLSATDLHVFFETPRGVRYVSRILEGSYPDADRVIKPQTPELTITTDAENLRATMASISHMTGDRARAIRMELDGDLPVFSAANPDRGTSTATMNGKTEMSGRMGIWYDTKDTEAIALMDVDELADFQETEAKKDRKEELGINPDYITDSIAQLAPEAIVSMCFWDASSQMQITSADPSDVRVIMPIRL